MYGSCSAAGMPDLYPLLMLPEFVERVWGTRDLAPIYDVKVGATQQPTRAMMLRETQLFNLTGHPAISLPCGVTRDGLPCGLQLVGPRDKTAALVEVALACERLLS